MVRGKKWLLSPATLLAGALALTSCGDGGNILGLTDDEEESVVAPAADAAVAPSEDAVVVKETSELQLAGSLTVLPAKGDATLSLKNGSREVTLALKEGKGERKLNLRLTNEAFEIIEQAGEIMCFLGQTKFWEQAADSEENAEVYLAKVDDSKCERKSGESGGNGEGQSGNQATELTDMYVKSWRIPNKPLIAEFIVNENDGVEIHVRVIVVEPPSDFAPAGIFHMNFNQQYNGQAMGSGYILASREDDPDSDDPKFILGIGMDQEGDGRSYKTFGVAELTILDSGDVKGFVNSEMSGSDEYQGETMTFSSGGKARFDENYLNIDFITSYSGPWGSEEQELLGCYDLNQYKTSIFRYDLVDSEGKVVKRNSGFPIEFDLDDGTKGHGWAGYHGIWAGDSELSNGTTVQKVDWSGNSDSPTKTDYTVFTAPGKLTKLTKTVTTLGALKNVDLRYHDNQANGEYNVHWDGSNFVKKSVITYGDKGMVEEAASGTVTISENFGGIHFWVPSLNASIRIDYKDTLSDALTLSYHSEKIVSGTSELPTCNLVCFSNCPVMAPAATDFSGSWSEVSGLYKSTEITYQGSSQTYTSNRANSIATPLATYTFNATTQNLLENGTAFALPSGLQSSGSGEGGYMQNIWSGPLVCSSDVPADTSMGPYQLENTVSTFYRFSSGANNWDKFQGLKDSDGSFVNFEPSLELSYTHSTENDFDGDSTNDGKSFRISYAGPGQLHIPWKYNSEIGREMPAFSLKKNVKIGDYYVIPLEGDQRLVQVEDNLCSALSMDALPAIADLKADAAANEAITSVTLSWSAPDEEVPVKYIGGTSTSEE